MAQLDSTLSKRLLKGKLPAHHSLAHAWLGEGLMLSAQMLMDETGETRVWVPPELMPLYQEWRLLTARGPQQIM